VFNQIIHGCEPVVDGSRTARKKKNFTQRPCLNLTANGRE
jgi:hypothetical protein